MSWIANGSSRLKQQSDGSLECYKAKLVVKSFHQQLARYYGDIFSPVVRPGTILLVLSIAIFKGWSFVWLDVKNVFHHRDLHETVLMEQLRGSLITISPTKCVSSTSWFIVWSKPLGPCIKNSIHISSILGFRIHLMIVHICVPQWCWHSRPSHFYIDDIILTGSSSLLISQFIRVLSSKFDLKDLGFLKFFLGMEVHYKKSGLILSQTKYVLHFLHQFGMEGSKPVATPNTGGRSVAWPY